MHVEIPEKMKRMNIAEMSTDEIQQHMDAVAAEAAQEVTEADATLTLSAVGAPHEVFGIDINIAIGNLVLLNEIDSPFVTGDIGEDGYELDASKCVQSLYVLACGAEAVRPVMAIKQKIASLMRLETMCKGNPAMMDKLLDRAEKIAGANEEFALAAWNWYNENFVGHDFQEVLDGVLGALSDVMKVAEDLPESDEKKN